jgi:DNA-binding PadR family transcriptional regulator
MRTIPERTIKAVTTTEAAVLALLALEGERSGYDLLKQARRSIGFIWAPAKSQLYAVLPRLVQDGLASERTVKGRGRPDKQLYKTTRDGRAALRAWLDSDGDSSRDAFFLRVFVGGFADREALLGHVERFRAQVAAQLEGLRAVEPSNTDQGPDAYHRLLLELGVEQYELELRWADRVARKLKRLPA